MKLSRKMEQWENCEPEQMAYYLSDVAKMHAFKDAKHDLIAMHEEISRLQFQLENIRAEVEEETVQSVIDFGNENAASIGEIGLLRVINLNMPRKYQPKQECTHEWRYQGHGHNYSVYGCTKCGAQKEE